MRKFGVVDTLQLISVIKFQQGQLVSAGQFLDIPSWAKYHHQWSIKGPTIAKVYCSNIPSYLAIHALRFSIINKDSDANASLSIQVHPDDAYAKNMGARTRQNRVLVCYSCRTWSLFNIRSYGKTTR